ncbi:hypothetical protein cypCar_00005424 [Cyprinus carpio]|nr:hypothetical protein cypCar_00005424 [Cyprinus carpio]
MASQRQNDSSAGYQPLFKSFATDAIHVGSEPEQWNSRAVVPPISLSTTFKQHGPGKHAGFDYSRCGNPTRSCLERAVAALDGAQYCLALSSGTAATLTITHLLKTGDGILCMNDVYGGTNEYFSKIAAEFGLDVSFADLTKLELLKAALKANTKMLWIETPTNPTLKVVDIKGCADIVHEHNKDIIVVVDNTFMSPYFQRPLALGADICMYSATKYMNGLPSHPQHELTKRQCTGCPGMISFYIKGKLEHASTFLSSLKLFTLADSLGGVESLAEHPVSMTHVSVPENEKKELGISDTLIRLSVGLEDEENIIADLDQALAAAECFNSPYGTGFFAEYAEKIPGESTKVLSEAAKDCGVYLVGGSIPEEDGGKLYNSCSVFGPDGKPIVKHRKGTGISSSVISGARMASQRQNDSSAGYQPLFKSFATDAIHVGSEPEQWNSRAVVPPISLSTTFKQQGPGKHAGFEYSRSGNPTRNCLERAVASLDGAQYCLALASGLAATLTITHLFKAGDGILCMNDVYGGTNRYFRKIAAEVGFDISFADLTKLEELKAALKPNTKMVWIETPTNPTMKVVDIKGCADIVHEHNKDIIVVVDNTFMSAYFQRPLALGADICMYSATKYMNGHSDVVMGLISLNRDDIYERLKFLQNGKALLI